MESQFEEIFQKRQGVIRYGLERVKEAYKLLQLDRTLAPSILVAGTNGKGSTSGFMAKLFDAAGFKVGLFTSPHLVHFRERIQCSNKPVSDGFLKEQLEDLKRQLPESLYDELSFFEITTLLAFKVFSNEKTQVNVIEVGLGGLLDATNIINPVASVVVSIGYDHQSILGDTLPKIFEQKLGITREGVPLFLGLSKNKLKEQGLESTLADFLIGKNMPLYQKGEDFSVDSTGVILDGNFGVQRLELPISAQHIAPILKENFSLALCVVYQYLTQNNILFSYDKILEAYNQSSFVPHSLLARFQKFNWRDPEGEHQEVYLDVCHNLESLKETYRTFKAFGLFDRYGKVPVYVSILNDKPLDSMLDYVKAFADPLVLFSCTSSRSFSVNDGQEDSFGRLPFYESFYEAWKNTSKGRKKGSPILVCGSFFAVGEVFELIQPSSFESSVA